MGVYLLGVHLCCTLVLHRRRNPQKGDCGLCHGQLGLEAPVFLEQLLELDDLVLGGRGRRVLGTELDHLQCIVTK